MVVFGVWLLDYKLKVDDPVGAVAVHMMNGIWGTFATGLICNKVSAGLPGLTAVRSNPVCSMAVDLSS